MAKETINLREKLRALKFELGLLQRIHCNKQETDMYKKILSTGGTLPENVYVHDTGDISTTEFFTIYETDLTEVERNEYLICEQLSLIKTIKNCVMFFTILTIIGMIAYLLIMLSTF